MNIKRIYNRAYEEIRSTLEIARVTSLSKAIMTFIGKIDIQIMVHNGHIEWEWIKRHLLKKHDVMNEYFDKTFSEFVKNYSYKEDKKNITEDYSNYVWICWWQGLEKAPEIVKKCVQSIKNNAGQHKVIIITEDNYKKYVSFPKWIEEKYKKGIITRTHLSDLLRIQLLSNYGGVWLDSTFYCTDSVEYYFSQPVWTIKRPDYRHVSVACGYFANYSFGCDYNHRKVFAIIYDFLIQYWKMYDYMIDYLFLDYLIVQAQRHNLYVNTEFKKIKANNSNCDELLKIMNLPYNEKMWNEMKKNTNLFKLTWKADFKKEIDGKKTFYGKLIDGELN